MWYTALVDSVCGRLAALVNSVWYAALVDSVWYTALVNSVWYTALVDILCGRQRWLILCGRLLLYVWLAALVNSGCVVHSAR